MTEKKLCLTCLDVPFMVPPRHVQGDEMRCPECGRVVPLRRPVSSTKISATDGMVLPVLVPTGLKGPK